MLYLILRVVFSLVFYSHVPIYYYFRKNDNIINLLPIILINKNEFIATTYILYNIHSGIDYLL